MADPVSTALSLAQLIVPSVEPVIRRLIEERRERKQMEKGLEKEIQRLFSNMEALKDLLHDADKKQYQSASLRTWLMKLKEVVSDADDVLDEYATDLAISQMDGGSQLLNPDGWRVKAALLFESLGKRHVEIKDGGVFQMDRIGGLVITHQPTGGPLLSVNRYLEVISEKKKGEYLGLHDNTSG